MTAEQFYNFHRSQLDGWEHGEIKEVWTDADGNGGIIPLTKKKIYFFGD